MIELVGKALIIPKEGWNAHNFRVYGRAMIMTMHRIAQIEQRRAIPHVAREASKHFREQLDEILKRFESNRGFLGRSAKAVVIFTSAHENLLKDIINQVLEETRTDARASIISSVQSVMAKGYSKTSVLLAQKPDIAHNTALQRRAQGLASKITQIGETTRKRFETILGQAVDSGLSVVETTKLIRTRIPEINDRRSLTIARTELGNGWAQGSAQAFKESSTVSEVSVIGCESREENLWDTPSYQQFMYKGESKCNYEDLPVAELDAFMEGGWHPNHSGSLIPSAFRED